MSLTYILIFNQNMNDIQKQIRKGFFLASAQDPTLYFPIDVVDLVGEFATKPPKEYAPPFMEKYTIFISKHSWQDILKISAARLTQLGCECKTENFSLHCIFYNEQRCVNMPFHVNVFTPADSADEYVVEFRNRESGNTLEFLELFAQFIQQDEGCGLVNRGRKGAILPRPRPDDQFFGPAAFQNSNPCPFGPVLLDEDALDCLLHMLEPGYYKVQTQGLAALATLVQTKANCILMRRTPLFVSLLCSFLDAEPNSVCDKITYPTLIILKFLLNANHFVDPLGGDGEEQKKLVSQLDISKISSLQDHDLGPTINHLIKSVITAYTSEDLA